MWLIVLGAWLGGVIVSFCNGNRKLPITVLLLGLALLFAPLGIWRIPAFVLLTVVIWIANKADTL